MTEPNPEAFSEAAPHSRPTPASTLIAAPKPFGVDYGYVDGSQPVESTREELIARLDEGRPTPLVWTPESEGIVPPWAVDYLFEAYRGHGVRHSRKVALTWGGIGAALLLYAAAKGNFSFLNGFVLGGFLALVVGFYSFLEWGRFRRLTPDKLTLKVREQASRPPPRRGPARYTQAVAASIALVMVLQSLTALILMHKPPPIMLGASAMNPSIDAAGMVRVAVEHGEWWRLLSAAYLHDGLLHFGMNLMALLALGRMIEAFGHRAYVPILFFLTALAASAASYGWSGAEASVGASGGILGLFGFLAVMARRRRELMPAGFGRAIVTDIFVIAAIGVLGYGHVDNWAHAGGFVSGAFLGWLMIPRGGRTPYWEPSPAIRILGDVALGLTLLAAIGTALVLALTLV